MTDLKPDGREPGAVELRLERSSASVRRTPPGGVHIAIEMVGVVVESARSTHGSSHLDQVWVADSRAVEELMSSSLVALAQARGMSTAYRLLTALWDRLEG